MILLVYFLVVSFFCLLHGRRTPLEFSAVYNGYYTHCVSDRQNYLSLVLFTMVTIHIVCPTLKFFCTPYLLSFTLFEVSL